jgi:hypothetical protein
MMRGTASCGFQVAPAAREFICWFVTYQQQRFKAGKADDKQRVPVLMLTMH